MNENAPRLNPAQAARFCIAVLKASRAGRKSGNHLAIVPLMIGLPGTGKTSVVRQIARKLGYDGIIVTTPTIHGTFDLRGLPFVTPEGETKFAPSNVLPRDGKWLILIDELGDCPIHEQSGFYQLLLDRRLGEYRVPEESDIIAATNDETMGACANPLSSAIKTRVAPCYVVSEVDQTVKHALENRWDHKVIGYIRTNPDVLTGFDIDDYAGGSTSRGLEQLSMLEQNSLDSRAVLSDNTLVESLVCSVLGIDHGKRYAVYRMLDLPELEPVFKTPKTAEIPTEIGKKHAFAAMIASACDDQRRFQAVVEYAERFTDRVDRVGLVADCVRAHKGLKNTAAFAQFCAQNGDILI